MIDSEFWDRFRTLVTMDMIVYSLYFLDWYTAIGQYVHRLLDITVYCVYFLDKIFIVKAKGGPKCFSDGRERAKLFSHALRGRPVKN